MLCSGFPGVVSDPLEHWPNKPVNEWMNEWIWIKNGMIWEAKTGSRSVICKLFISVKRRGVDLSAVILLKADSKICLFFFFIKCWTILLHFCFFYFHFHNTFPVLFAVTHQPSYSSHHHSLTSNLSSILPDPKPNITMPNLYHNLCVQNYCGLFSPFLFYSFK